ncbi:MAG: DUF134 domain-containing protein [Elusimicrobia bacterium]|nr:DUF134 domain-containing protein [Elusimicrobiota bacterium]
MVRPLKRRRIANQPGATYFKPRGIPMTELAEVVLTLDEIEAVRLADLEGLYQETAAAKMRISRQTFGNIIHAARAKIADAIVEGKALRIEGGSFRIADRDADAQRAGGRRARRLPSRAGDCARRKS